MKTILSIVIFFLLAPLVFSQNFQGTFDLIATQNYPNGNIRTDTVTYYFSSKKTAVLIHSKRNEPDMRMIFDPEDKSITALFTTDGKKYGYTLPMDELHWPGMSQAMRPFNTTSEKELKYTGNQKEMEGYLCKEVEAENEDYTAALWIAEGIPLSMTHLLSYQSVGKGKSKKEIELFDQFGVNGLPLLTALNSKKGKANVVLHIKNLKKTVDKSIFSSEGHTISKME